MSLSLPPNVNDLRGREFGRLTVRNFAGIRGGKAYWECDCSCNPGAILPRAIRGTKLTSGATLSCGCYRADPLLRRAARLTMSEEDRRAAAGGKKVRTPKPPSTRPAPKRQKRILPLLPDVGVRAPEKVPEAPRFNEAGAREAYSTAPPAPAQGREIRIVVTILKRRGENRVRGADGRLHATQPEAFYARIQGFGGARAYTESKSSRGKVARYAEQIFGKLDWPRSEEPEGYGTAELRLMPMESK